MIEQRPTGPGRPRWWIGGAITLAVGLVLVAIGSLLASRASEDMARTPTGAPAMDATPVAEANPLARPASTGERVPLATVGGEESAPAATDPPPSAGSALARWTGAMSTFTGSVVDQDGRPLPGATVTCWPSELTRDALGLRGERLGPEIDPSLQTMTDEAGHFVLRVPHVALESDKSYAIETRDFPWLFVDAEGFAVRGVLCVGLLAGDYDAGSIAVEPGGYLVGRAVDERGQPVAGVRLRARQTRCEPLHVATEDDWQAYLHIEPAVSDISGDDGRFELGGFWPGTASTWITASGYLASSRESDPIEVGARRELGDVVLSSGASLSGVVVDDTAMPLAGATVLVEANDADRYDSGMHDTVLHAVERLRKSDTTDAKTDADGRFMLTGLKPTNYRLYVDAPGFEPLGVRDVTTGPEVLHLALVRQATLHLTVIDEETKAPIAGAGVEAVRRAGETELWPEPHLSVHAGSEADTYIVERIGTWRTDLVVAASGYATGVFSVEAATPPQPIRRTVELEREARITGRVLSADGQPVAAATVSTVTPKEAPNERPVRRAAADADGLYELVALTAGDWTLNANAKGFVSAERTLTVPTAGTLPDIDFQLEAAATIFGTCFAGDGRPVPGKRVVLKRPAETHLKGDWIVALSDVHGDYRAENLRAGTWEVGDNPEVVVEVAIGQSVRADLHEQKPSLIRGRVLANGRPKTGVVVMALDRTMEKRVGFAAPSGFARVEADGRYELEVPAGEYFMQAGGVDPPCGGSQAVPLTLGWGEQRVVDLVFSGERVSVLVVEAGTGSPLMGARVSLKRASETDPLTPAFSFGNQGDMTEFWPYSDAEGRIELPFVLPGNYSMRCGLDGYLDPEVPQVSVTAGQPLELRVELEAGASLRGSAKLASGVPVGDYTSLTMRPTAAVDGPNHTAETVNGAFVFVGLPAGEYILAIWPSSSSRPSQPPLLELPVTLKPGESRTVELQLPP